MLFQFMIVTNTPYAISTHETLLMLNQLNRHCMAYIYMTCTVYMSLTYCSELTEQQSYLYGIAGLNTVEYQAGSYLYSIAGLNTAENQAGRVT